jgi:hypothetical protein
MLQVIPEVDQYYADADTRAPRWGLGGEWNRSPNRSAVGMVEPRRFAEASDDDPAEFLRRHAILRSSRSRAAERGFGRIGYLVWSPVGPTTIFRGRHLLISTL